MYRYITDNKFWYSLIVVTSGYANKCSLILDQIIKGESSISKDLGQKCYIKNSRENVVKYIDLLNQCVNKNKFREMYFPDFGSRAELLKAYSIVSEFLSDFADTILFRNYTNRKGRKITIMNTLLSEEDRENIKYFHKLYTSIFECEYDKALHNMGLSSNIVGFRKSISIYNTLHMIKYNRIEIVNMDIAKFFNNVDMKKFFDNDVINVLFNSILGKKYEYLEYLFDKPLNVFSLDCLIKNPEDFISYPPSFKFDGNNIISVAPNLGSFAFIQRRSNNDKARYGRMYNFLFSNSSNVNSVYNVNDAGYSIRLRDPSVPDKREFFLQFFYRTLSFLMHNNKLPTGASYSPVLSNIFLLDFDIKLKNLLDSMSINTKYNFVRYADDITIYTSRKNISSRVCVRPIDERINLYPNTDDITSSDSEIDFSVVKKVEKLINQYGLYLNYSKTKIFRKHEEASILGLTIPAVDKAPISDIKIGSAKRKEMIDLISNSLDFDYDSKTRGFLSYCISNGGMRDFIIHHGMNSKLNDPNLKNVFDKYFNKLYLNSFRELFHNISKDSKSVKVIIYNDFINIRFNNGLISHYMHNITVRKDIGISEFFIPHQYILDNITSSELRLALIYYIMYKEFVFLGSCINRDEYKAKLLVKTYTRVGNVVSFPLNVYSDAINEESYYSDMRNIFEGDKMALEYIDLFEAIENSRGTN